MRLTVYISGLYLAATVVNGLLVPPNSYAHVVRDAALDEDAFASVNHLVPRKGGGGRGGGSSGGSSGGSRSSGSSSSSSGRGSSTSNAGGRTTTGSGVRPAYGGAYGGGGSVPYAAGARNARGFLPLGLFAIGATALIFPGLWLYGAYYYPWSNPHRFYNASSQQNETKPVLCLCQEYSVCGCEENTNSTYMTAVIGDGDFAKLNTSLAYVNDVNGTSTIIINGTLPNGTTADGGTESAEGEISAASASIPRNVVTTLFSMGVFWALWMM